MGCGDSGKGGTPGKPENKGDNEDDQHDRAMKDIGLNGMFWQIIRKWNAMSRILFGDLAR